MTADKQLPLVVAIVLNFNGRSITYKGTPILDRCLGTLVETDYGNLELILADASSSDDSVEFVRRNFARAEVVLVRNIGCAYANNKAIEYAFKRFPSLRYILLLNNDLIFMDGTWLKRMVAMAESSRAIGIVGCELHYPDGSIQHAGGYIDRFGRLKTQSEALSGKADFVTGAVFLVKREVMESVGLFDEIYCPFYWEETDFCARARTKGFLTFFVAGTNITHLEKYSTGAANLKGGWNFNTIDLAGHRNKYIFLARWHKFSVFPHVFVEALILIDSLITKKAFMNRPVHGMSAKTIALTEVKALVLALGLYKQHIVPRLEPSSEAGKNPSQARG